jgi:hypothetical protein
MLRASLLVLALALPTVSAAFGCKRADTISEAVARPDAYVFKGIVIGISTIGLAPELASVTFKPITIYRGEQATSLVVVFGSSYDTRPLRFKPGEIYLVSASPAKLQLSSSQPAFPEGEILLSDMCSLRKRTRRT